jgi:hypothetical protein
LQPFCEQAYVATFSSNQPLFGSQLQVWHAMRGLHFVAVVAGLLDNFQLALRLSWFGI